MFALAALLGLSALSSITAAAPLTGNEFPLLSSSSQLLFFANVTAKDLTPPMNGQKLYQGPDAAPNYYDFAILPGTFTSSANYFYPNGTADQIDGGSTTMGAYSQSPPFYPAIKLDLLSQMGPNGVTVATVVHNVSYSSPPYLWQYPPTLGVKISTDDGYAKLVAPADRQWYVCAKQREAHSATFTLYLVYTRAADETTPAGCADINIIPQCTSFSFDADYTYDAGAYAFDAPCYEDASVIYS